MANGYKTAKQQARYVDNLAGELTIIAAAIIATTHGRDQLEALTEQQQEQMVEIGRKVRGLAVPLEDIAEAVGKAVETTGR